MDTNPDTTTDRLIKALGAVQAAHGCLQGSHIANAGICSDYMADAAVELHKAIKEIPYIFGWQPIETAPKDGSNILAHTDDGPVVVYWCKWPSGQENWEAVGVTPTYDDSCVDLESEPTHWMPLPAGPADVIRDQMGDV